MSVPCSIIHAGGTVKFKKSNPILKGAYQLDPTPVWDSALRFTKNMYLKNNQVGYFLIGVNIAQIKISIS